MMYMQDTRAGWDKMFLEITRMDQYGSYIYSTVQLWKFCTQADQHGLTFIWRIFRIFSAPNEGKKITPKKHLYVGNPSLSEIWKDIWVYI